MQRTNIYLDGEQTAALDRRAAELGVSRAEIIRRLIDDGLGRRSADRDSDLAAIASSAGAVADIDVIRTGRRDEARSRHLDRIGPRGA